MKATVSKARIARVFVIVLLLWLRWYVESGVGSISSIIHTIVLLFL